MREDVMYFLLSEPDIYTATATFNAIGVCFPVAVVRPYEIQCKLQCNSMQFNAIRCNSMQFNAIQCNSMQFNSIQFEVRSSRTSDFGPTGHVRSSRTSDFGPTNDVRSSRTCDFGPKSDVRSSRTSDLGPGSDVRSDRTLDFGPRAVFDPIEHPISGHRRCQIAKERCSIESNIRSRANERRPTGPNTRFRPKICARPGRTSHLGSTSGQ
jgi:hypothetical protein